MSGSGDHHHHQVDMEDPNQGQRTASSSASSSRPPSAQGVGPGQAPSMFSSPPAGDHMSQHVAWQIQSQNSGHTTMTGMAPSAAGERDMTLVDTGYEDMPQSHGLNGPSRERFTSSSQSGMRSMPITHPVLDGTPLANTKAGELLTKAHQDAHENRSSTINTTSSSRMQSLNPRQRFREAALRVMAAQRVYKNPFNVPDPHPGSAPGIDPKTPQPSYEGLHQLCAIQCYDYNDSKLTYRNDLTNSNLARFLNKPRPEWSKVRWINVDGLSWDVLKRLAIHYDLHPLALEDALHTPRRSKADFYENQIFLSLICLSTETLTRQSEKTSGDGNGGTAPRTNSRRASRSNSVGAMNDPKIEDDPIFLQNRFGGTAKSIWDAISSRSSSFHSQKTTRASNASSYSHHGHKKSSKRPWPIFSHKNGEDENSREYASPASSPPGSPRGRQPSMGKLFDNTNTDALRRRATSLRRTSATNKIPTGFHQNLGLGTSALPSDHPDASEYRIFKTSIFSQGSEYMYAMVRDYRDWIVMMEPASIFFLDNGTVITMFPENGERVTAPIQRRLVRTKTLLRMSQDPSFLVNTLVDAVVDHGLPIMEKYRRYIGDLEEKVMVRPKYAFTRVLHLVHSELQLFRRVFSPLHQVVSNLATKKHDQNTMITKLTRTYLGDVLDNATAVLDSLDADFQWTKDLIELIFNSMSYQSNESMKTLAIMSAYFLPWTFFAGIYGMNFRDGAIPELGWWWGYYWFWGVIVLCGLLVFLLLHRRMWHR